MRQVIKALQEIDRAKPAITIELRENAMVGVTLHCEFKGRNLSLKTLCPYECFEFAQLDEVERVILKMVSEMQAALMNH